MALQLSCEKCDELVREYEIIYWNGVGLCHHCILEVIQDLKQDIIKLNNLLGEE